MPKMYLHGGASYIKKFWKFIKEKRMKAKMALSRNIVVIYTELHTVQFAKLKYWNNYHK